jgi:hypothetical protein
MSSFRRFSMVFGLLLVGVVAPRGLQAQQQMAVNDAKLMQYAKAFLEVTKIQDAIDPQLAAVKNKTAEAQRTLHEQRKEQIAKAITAQGLTENEYNSITYVVSTTQDRREAFDKLIADLKAAAPASKPSTP